MKLWCGLVVAAAVGLGPSSAVADVTIEDWRGESITASEGSADSDGVNIVFHTAGEGPLVVFVHSIVGPWFDWRNQMVALSEHYRVVAMSTRGTDKSDKPTGVENYTMAKISGDIAAIIDHFGEERAIVVGQDSGGFYAWHFAMTHPDKTERLISLGTVHPAGLIRELASDPEQQQASMFQRGMQENPNAAADFGARMRAGAAQGGGGDPLAALRAEAINASTPNRSSISTRPTGRGPRSASRPRASGSGSGSSPPCRRRRSSSTERTASRSRTRRSTTRGAGATAS